MWLMRAPSPPVSAVRIRLTIRAGDLRSDGETWIGDSLVCDAIEVDGIVGVNLGNGQTLVVHRDEPIEVVIRP